MYQLHCMSPCRVRAEPRLGFNWIASAERNAWNDVLSRVLSDKVTTWIFNCLSPQLEYKTLLPLPMFPYVCAQWCMTSTWSIWGDKNIMKWIVWVTIIFLNDCRLTSVSWLFSSLLQIQAEAKHYLWQRNAKETVHECGKIPVINVEE